MTTPPRRVSSVVILLLIIIVVVVVVVIALFLIRITLFVVFLLLVGHLLVVLRLRDVVVAAVDHARHLRYFLFAPQLSPPLSLSVPTAKQYLLTQRVMNARCGPPPRTCGSEDLKCVCQRCERKNPKGTNAHTQSRA